MSIMQQFGDNERGRSLQRAGQSRPGASRSAGDESNKRTYKTMRYVEGERSQGRRASYEQGGRVGKESFSDENKLADKVKGGQGASRIEDLLEKLSDYKKSQYGNKYKAGGKFPDLTGDGKVTMADILKGRGVNSGKFEQGGEVKGDGYSIKIAGQNAVGSIKTIPDSGQQYVSMELPDGKVVPVFGDWESYGNPNREGLIEDLDYRIFPLGDGTYSLDAGEMESEMMRDDSRKVAREAQGGQGASRMEDLMEKLSDYKGMGQTPSGRMRPYKRQ